MVDVKLDAKNILYNETKKWTSLCHKKYRRYEVLEKIAIYITFCLKQNQKPNFKRFSFMGISYLCKKNTKSDYIRCVLYRISQ